MLGSKIRELCLILGVFEEQLTEAQWALIEMVRDRLTDLNPAAKVHLTSKPVDLLVDLLQITPEGGTILDPFMGGGTTAVACQQTGRRFIGVELSREYYELAGERIRARAELAQAGA